MKTFRNDGNGNSEGTTEPSPMKQVTTPSIPTKEQRDSGEKTAIKDGRSNENEKHS